jgi:SAM-dependent methyltransferase
MNQLVRLLGFPATLIHGDALVLDRWLWLKEHLPARRDNPELLDVGCGSGAFTIGAALRGYKARGVSWDERNQKVATERALICKAYSASFDVQDVRDLDQCMDFRDRFDVVVCCENIEHILNDEKLVRDMTACLKEGGVLLLTTPNVNFIPVTELDNTPRSKVEDGGHVRRGYSPEMLTMLCDAAGLRVDQIGFCSGFVSQKITWLQRIASRIHHLFGWLVILPLRILPPLVDPWLSTISRWPGYSITLVARKVSL